MPKYNLAIFGADKHCEFPLQSPDISVGLHKSAKETYICDSKPVWRFCELAGEGKKSFLWNQIYTTLLASDSFITLKNFKPFLVWKISYTS